MTILSFVCLSVFAVSAMRVMFQPTTRHAAQTLMNVLLTMADVPRFVSIPKVVICVSAARDTMPLTLSK